MLKKLSYKTILSFCLSLVFCFCVISAILSNQINYEKSLMEQIALEKSIKITETLSKLLYKTQVLSTLAIKNDGEINDFERVAATIIDDPVILNVLIAPSGVVSDVYPLEGNEAVIGLNFLEEGAGNKEAVQAKETGSLVLGGPFTLVQGGEALVGRLPVFMDSAYSGKEFWGIVSITLKFPQILDNIGLETLEKRGLTYKLWRINPDDNEKQIIAHGSNSYNDQTRFVEKKIQVFNSEWYLSIYPVLAWYERLESWIMILIGICLSFLLAFIVQNNVDLKRMKSNFKELAQTDSLTGLNNRGHFMDLALMQFEKSKRLKSNCYVVLFDLDHFKLINDQYGHAAGDTALVNVAENVKSMIRSYDIFARYGGEEFIMLISDIEETHITGLAERFRAIIEKTPVLLNNISISVTASFGIAFATSADTLDTAIKYADTALYEAKAKGRNQIVFYEGSPEIQLEPKN